MFEPTSGYMTNILKNEFLELMVPESKHNTIEVQSMYYHHNDSDKLYFWQLYSLLGENKINIFIIEYLMMKKINNLYNLLKSWEI